MKQTKFLIARCLTLLILALLSTNLAWGGVEKVSASQLESGGKYVIVATYDKADYLLKPTTFSAKGSTAESFVAATVTDASAWTFTKSGDTWTIKLSTGEGLYFTNDNNGVACAEKKGASFTITATTTDATTSYLTASDGTNTRYLALYQDSNWRCYKNTNSGVPTIQLYKITDAPAAKLTSIAISGTPKTTYEAGEEFDIAGLVVTGTYSDATTADLTDDAEWDITPSGALTAGTTSVSVTATVDGKTATETYNVTVTEHVVTPGTYEIALNKDLYGITTAGNVAKEQSAKAHDITVVSGCSSSASSKTYYDPNHIRYYTDSYLKLSVPAGYEITSVVFTADGTWNGSTGISVNTGSYSDKDNKTWTGKAQKVDFSFSQQCRAAKITVTYAAKKTLSGITVKNNPTKTTYYVGDDFDPAGLVITASYDDESTEDIVYTEDNKDAFSFSGFNSEAEATDQVITVTYAEKSATFTIDIEEARTLNSITVASNPDKVVYEVGEALDLTGLVVNGIFSKGDPEPVEYTADPADGTTLDAVGTTTVTLTSVDNTELTTSFDVTVKAIEGDRITLTETGVSGGYAAWTDSYTGPSGAVYTGLNAGGNSAIQLRSDATGDKPASGIISTTSGGNIAKVKVVWESHTTNERELEVFGSNTAYTAVADLVDNTKKGTSLGTIKNGTSTELEIDGKYAYVGVRSKSGAMYLTSITFVWKEEETYTRTVNTANIGTLCVPYAFEKPDYMTLYNIVGKDDSKIYFEETEDVVAGQPYLFRSTEGTITLTYTGEKATEAGTNNGLVGTFDVCEITPEDGNYILSNNTLYLVDGDFNCGANRAYIHIGDVSDYNPTAKADFTLDFNDPTGIESITPTFSEGKEVYNLNGMRVNGSYKGIVVVNGKKFINK